MDFLFKHIKDNSFKLNETVYHLDTMSKEEEQNTFQYVRRKLIPAIVNHFISFYPTQNITVDKLSKGLKKSSRSDDHFKIYTYPLSAGELAINIVKFEEPGIEIGVYWYHGPQWSDKLMIPGTGKMRLSEGRIKIVNRPMQGKKLISKEEEQQALQYIRSQIIPLVFKHYNSRQMDIYKLKSPSDISHSLRKMSIKYDPEDKEEVITYEALHPTIDNNKFVFLIRKTEGYKEGQIGIHYISPPGIAYWFNSGEIPPEPLPFS